MGVKKAVALPTLALFGSKDSIQGIFGDQSPLLSRLVRFKCHVGSRKVFVPNPERSVVIAVDVIAFDVDQQLYFGSGFGFN